MKKGAKDKKFFNLKKASSDTKLNDTVNEVEVMLPSEDILSENTKKKKGLDFSKIRKKKKERKQQMEEVIAEIDVGTLQQENQTEEYGQPPKRAQTAEELPGVQEQAGNETAPKTGDLFRIIGWIVLAVLSGGGACMIGKGQRKKPRI